MDASLEKQSMDAVASCAENRLLAHFTTSFSTPSHSVCTHCTFAAKWRRVGQINVSLQGTRHVCSGKAFGVSSVEFADRDKNADLDPVQISVSNQWYWAYRFYCSVGVFFLFERAAVCISFQCHLVGSGFISLVDRVPVTHFKPVYVHTLISVFLSVHPCVLQSDPFIDIYAHFWRLR